MQMGTSYQNANSITIIQQQTSELHTSDFVELPSNFRSVFPGIHLVPKVPKLPRAPGGARGKTLQKYDPNTVYRQVGRLSIQIFWFRKTRWRPNKENYTCIHWLCQYKFLGWSKPWGSNHRCCENSFDWSIPLGMCNDTCHPLGSHSLLHSYNTETHCHGSYLGC